MKNQSSHGIKNSSIILVEALRSGQEQISAVLGLLAIGLMFLSIYLFGEEAAFSYFAFPAFFVMTALFLVTGVNPARKNIWFARLFTLLNLLMELLALAGWIWVLYLSQENPGGKYTALADLHFTTFLLFFLLIDGPGFIGLMISIFCLQKSQKKKL